jgi:hypothetical protein
MGCTKIFTLLNGMLMNIIGLDNLAIIITIAVGTGLFSLLLLVLVGLKKPRGLIM